MKSAFACFGQDRLLINLPRRFNLSLTTRAVEARPARLDDAAHLARAAGSAAGGAFAAVNVETVLKITKFAIGPAEVAQRGAAGLDGLNQHRPHPFGEPGHARGRHRPGAAAGRYPGPVERLADIDIAQPGDDSLIE